MKIYEKFFEGKISYEDIDKFVHSIQATLDPDDEFTVEYDIQEHLQFIRVQVLDRDLH